jgi:hypothetical protein
MAYDALLNHFSADVNVPVIDCPVRVPANEPFPVSIELAPDQAPDAESGSRLRNECLIKLYFLPSSEPAIQEVGAFVFTGPCAETSITTKMRIDREGTLLVTAFSTRGGLRESSQPIAVF